MLSSNDIEHPQSNLDLSFHRPSTTNSPISPFLSSTTANMGGGGKIPYPKHVWSPAGGWYAQPHNWKSNTMVFGLAIAACTAVAWNVSAQREHRNKMPERNAFFPSR
jgi:hypothetical protein